MNKKPFELISYQQAVSQYHIAAAVFESEDVFNDVIDENLPFYLYEGDLKISGNLNLDTDVVDRILNENEVAGYIITGNLEVTGNIINDEGDYGPIFYVQGDVSCRSLVIGGCPTRITGNVFAEEVIMLHYNHGWMQCDGTFIAPVMIVEDYHLQPGAAKNISRFYYNDREEEFRDETGEWRIPAALQEMLNNRLTTDFEELRRDLVAGEHVLLQQERPYAYWEQKVAANWRDLQRVPVTFRKEALCMTALHQYVGALEFFPALLITDSLVEYVITRDGKGLRYVPASMVTPELCRVAARNGASLKADFPEDMLDYELVYTVIQNDPAEMESVPVHFIDEDLLAAYVKTGYNLWLQRYCDLAGIAKIKVLQRVMDEGVDQVDYVFRAFLTNEVYHYARERYDTVSSRPQWEDLTQRYAKKIAKFY
ncbi:polymer-forming cytoskeletal protein [Chitinophaga sp. Mgbs1]|uniref:Polymer-forming cytoskeletal protein n=1 Tax=Chitinophaga solisilvae TaxID=1233460 RepID=A0A433WMT6_9BACT|nr:polymer-forming cytoskeletal protein [Chitinophaga solisilvae]